MVVAYWLIGKSLFESQNSMGSTYGKQLIKYTAERLQQEFGAGYDERNLRLMRQFYEVYPKWNGKSTPFTMKEFWQLVKENVQKYKMKSKY